MSTHLRISSDGAPDFDGMPGVDSDGVALHNVTIKKVDETGADIVTGSEPIRVMVSAGIPVSSTSPILALGTVTITVGPSSNPCDIMVMSADPASAMAKGAVKIRFK